MKSVLGRWPYQLLACTLLLFAKLLLASAPEQAPQLDGLTWFDNAVPADGTDPSLEFKIRGVGIQIKPATTGSDKGSVQLSLPDAQKNYVLSSLLDLIAQYDAEVCATCCCAGTFFCFPCSWVGLCFAACNCGHFNDVKDYLLAARAFILSNGSDTKHGELMKEFGEGMVAYLDMLSQATTDPLFAQLDPLDPEASRWWRDNQHNQLAIAYRLLGMDLLVALDSANFAELKDLCCSGCAKTPGTSDPLRALQSKLVHKVFLGTKSLNQHFKEKIPSTVISLVQRDRIIEQQRQAARGVQ
jgi:hypothetical protein